MDQTVPLLSRKYAANRRTWNAKELVFDVGTVIMWECRRAAEIIELAEAMDTFLQNEDGEKEGLLQTTVDSILRVVVQSIYPQEEPILVTDNHPTADSSLLLRRLLDCALTLRNALSNAQINELRRQQFSVLASYMRSLDRANPISISTRRWIQSAVLRCERSTITRLLAPGDPFALLRLHDQAIIDIVLCRDTVHYERRYGLSLQINAVPDILYFDFERLKAVHHTLHTCPEEEFYSRGDFSDAFHELVTSGDAPKKGFSAQVTDAAEQIRAVVFVCRYRHGNAVAKVAQEIAKAITMMV